jgi:hypothetical protein
MVFCHEWQQVGDGQICFMPISADFRRSTGNPETLFSASQAPWAAPLPNRPPGSYVTDGPNLRRGKDGSLHMLWSSFGPDGRYRLGVAHSESGKLTGPWKQSQEPLFAADGGHGMLFDTLGGKLFLAVHTPNRTPDERALFVEVEENGGRLSIKEGGDRVC